MSFMLTQLFHSADEFVAECCFVDDVLLYFRNENIFFKSPSYSFKIAVFRFVIAVKTISGLSGSGEFFLGVGIKNVVEFYDGIFPSCC